MKLIATNNITLENVKNSNYWNLLGILVWHHYSQEKFQTEDDGTFEFKEVWYGKKGSKVMYSSDWRNPDFKLEGYKRTLSSVDIEFKRSNYTTYISINAELGDILCFRIYNPAKKVKVILTASNSVKLCNWLLEHNFIRVVTDEEKL